MESDENQTSYIPIIHTHKAKINTYPIPPTLTYTIYAPIQTKESAAKGDVKESYSFISQDKWHKSQHLINCPKETIYYTTEAG